MMTVASPAKTAFSPRTKLGKWTKYGRNFFQKPFGETWYRVESANFLDAIFDRQGHDERVADHVFDWMLRAKPP